MTKVRLIRNDGGVLTLDATGFSMNFTRSVPVMPVPVLGERYALDINMVSADINLDVILADDDCSASSFQKTAASASIDFGALKDNSGGDHPFMMTGDGGTVTANDLNDHYFVLHSLYTGSTNGLKGVKVLFDSSTASHSYANNPPVATVGISGVSTGYDVATRVATALNAATFTDQLTTDGGTDFTDAFTITQTTSIKSAAGNAKLVFTQVETGAAGNTEVSFSPSFPEPYFLDFGGGTNKSCRSAGDKLQDLIAYVGNASLAGVSGRALGGPANPDDPKSIIEGDFSIATRQTEDYIVGIQLPYNSIITSTAANDDSVERNFIVVTGRSNASQQNSEANVLSVSSTFDATNPYTGISGTVTSMAFNYRAGENIYEGRLTFMPIDFMVGT